MNLSKINEKAYQLAEKHFGKKSFTFNELFNLVSKEEGLKTEDKDELVSDFYNSILKDVRFLYVGNGK
jgi:DNA-directed RNA polymerase delta subunit